MSEAPDPASRAPPTPTVLVRARRAGRLGRTGAGAAPAPRRHGRRWSGSTGGSRTPSTGCSGAWVTDMPVAAVQVHLDAPEPAPRLARRAVGRPAARLRRGRPRRADRALGRRARAVRRPGRPLAGHGRPRLDLASGRRRSPSGRPGALPRLAGLYRVVLPRLVTSYERHLRAAGPVTDGPVAPGPAPGAQRRDRGLAGRRAPGAAAGDPAPRRRRRPRVPPAPRDRRWSGPGARSGLVTFPALVPED